MTSSFPRSDAPIVVCRIKFQSVASPPKRDGKLLSKVMRVPLRAPFGSIFFRDFCRPLVGWSFGALAQACKQSSRRFTDSLHSLLFAVLHEQHQTTGEIGNVRIQVGVKDECR